jgi:hypothetical protein
MSSIFFLLFVGASSFDVLGFMQVFYGLKLSSLIFLEVLIT